MFYELTSNESAKLVSIYAQKYPNLLREVDTATLVLVCPLKKFFEQAPVTNYFRQSYILDGRYLLQNSGGLLKFCGSTVAKFARLHRMLLQLEKGKAAVATIENTFGVVQPVILTQTKQDAFSLFEPIDAENNKFQFGTIQFRLSSISMDGNAHTLNPVD